MMSRPREQRSLFGELIDWLLAPLLLVWPLSVALIWLVAQGIANRPFDRELGEMARSVARQVVVDPRAGTARLKQPGAANLLRSDDDDSLYFQVLGVRGEFVDGDRELPVPPDTQPAVAGELRFRDDVVHNEPVRVAYLLVEARDTGSPLVQVAETLRKRSQLATEIIKGVILPQFVVLPIAVLLVWLALERGIAPLGELQQRVRSREAHDLSPLDERDAPEEVAPLVGAINDLLARLDRSIGLQRRFLADAAHQLKTPLAGLRMQAELAQRELAGPDGAQQALRSLQQIARSSQRAAHMVNQLLAMARAEGDATSQMRQEVNLARLAIDTVRDFVPRALDKQLDLGYEGPEPQQLGHRILGNPLLVRELIRNLVDNALQYTPAGGTVTVRVVDDPFGQVMVLEVEDSGPGIAPADREHVFEPFWRALGTNVDGSGLGLAIVREIAQRHGGSIVLDDAHARGGDGAPGPGARFTLRFPALAPGDNAPSA
jgi:two-component system sensor histidine kinase TctE